MSASDQPVASSVALTGKGTLADELEIVAAGLIQQARNAKLASDGVCVRVKDPDHLIGLLVRATDALRSSGAGAEMGAEIEAIGHLRSYSTREQCAVACMDLADSYREVAEDHIRNRQAEPAAKAIAWADGALRCAAAVRALPLDGGRS